GLPKDLIKRAGHPLPRARLPAGNRGADNLLPPTGSGSNRPTQPLKVRTEIHWHGVIAHGSKAACNIVDGICAYCAAERLLCGGGAANTAGKSTHALADSSPDSRAGA